ncbi:MAG: glycosyltransferase [Proteobacteria bacterium]|nr:glycosyltransferase [Pseudomonadota bacterium]
MIKYLSRQIRSFARNFFKVKKVSVIIPFHGEENELACSIDTLLRQTSKDFEVIIVADHSKLSESIKKKFGQKSIPVKIIRNKRHVGTFQSRKRGAAHAKGKYLWFLDHDDAASEQFIEIMTSAAETAPAEVVECPFLMIPEAGEPWVHKRFSGAISWQEKDILKSYLRGGSNNSLANKIINRQLWNAAMASIAVTTDESIIFAEDMLCIVYIYIKAKSYRSIEGVFYHYMYRSSSTTNSTAPTRIAQSAYSLESVLEKIKMPLLLHADQNDLRIFVDREVNGALKHLEQKASVVSDIKIDEFISSLRRRYVSEI